MDRVRHVPRLKGLSPSWLFSGRIFLDSEIRAIADRYIKPGLRDKFAAPINA
jgi:hypothetical protein